MKREKEREREKGGGIGRSEEGKNDTMKEKAN
jgi:hypothetical protein